MGPGAAGSSIVAAPADGGRRVEREASAVNGSAPVVSYLAEGSDRGKAAMAGPPGTATLPLAGTRGSGSQIGGEGAVFELDPARGPLSLAAESVDCNSAWWHYFQEGWRPALQQRAAPRVRRAVERRHIERVRACGDTWKTLACECGARAVPIRCRERLLCPSCKRAYFTRIRERMTDAVAAAERSHPGWHWVHLRLSLRQEGTIERRRERWQRAWQRFRAWFRKRIGEAFPYCGAWECTGPPTAGENGNLHVHLIVRWPFIDYADVHEEWQRACDGDSIPGIGSWVEGVSTARGAVRYLTKYATKGVEPSTMPGFLAGQLLGAFYWRRLVQPSARWWVKHVCTCTTCGERWRYLGAWDRGLVVERVGYAVPWPVGRGPPSHGELEAHNRRSDRLAPHVAVPAQPGD